MGSTSPRCPPLGRSPRSGVGRRQPERHCSSAGATCAPTKTLAHLLSLAARRGATPNLVTQLLEGALEDADPEARRLVLETMLRNAACLKELVKALLARFEAKATELNADALIISTEADAIYRSFGTPDAVALSTLSLDEASRMEAEGEFPKGSMGPKVSALCNYVSNAPQGVGVLCSPGQVLEALRGEAGTTVIV